MITTILLIGVSSFIFYLLYKYILVQIQIRKTNTKGPGVLFWLHMFMKNGLSLNYTRWVHKNNITDFGHITLLSHVSLRAVDANAAKFLLSTHKDDFFKSFGARGPEYQKKWFMQNLVGANGSDWRRQRTIFTPAFNHKAYLSYYPIFVEKIEHVIAKLGENDKKDIDFVPWLHKLTIDVLGSSLFTYDFNTLENKHDEYYEAYTYILENFSILTTIYPFLENYPIPRIVRHKAAYLKLQELFAKMLSERKNESKNGNDVLDRLVYSENVPENENSEEISQKGFNENAIPHLTQDEIYSNLFIFFLAGHETTASALSWAVIELAKHPNEQQKLYEEISATVGDNIPSLEDLDKIVYLDQFISETLRIHPPVPQIGAREAAKDLTYPTESGKTIFIPKGMTVGVDVYAIHTSSKYWKNPFEFDPSRFSPENKKGCHKFQYLPFSLGPRECIGAKFSIIEQHVFLIRLLQKYKVEEPRDEPISDEPAKFLNKPLKSVVRLIPRK